MAGPVLPEHWPREASVCYLSDFSESGVRDSLASLTVSCGQENPLVHQLFVFVGAQEESVHSSPSPRILVG